LKITKEKIGLVISIVSVSVFLLVWEMASVNRWVSPILISSPSEILREAIWMLQQPSFWNHAKISAFEFSVGFLLAMVIAIPVGVFSGWNFYFNSLVNPFISALYVTPKLTILPVIIIAFGIGVESKIVLVFLMSFFPIVMSAQKAMNTLDQSLIKAARTFTASELQIFTTIALPSTVPFLLNGIRLGMGQGLIAMVVGEMFAASAGIGFMLTNYGQNLQTGRMFVGVIVITLTGLALTYVIALVEKRFSSWKPDLH